MKKTLICLIIVLSAFFTAAYADADVSVIIDGEELLTDAAPFVEDGTTLVPMRGIFEKLGAAVDWNGDTKTVTAEKGDTKIVLGIGSNIMKKNEDEVELIRAAVISNDRTFVPLRAVSEAFGADVDWNGDTKTVTIITAKETPAPEPTAVIPTPQPVTSVSNNVLPLSAEVIPQRRGAYFTVRSDISDKNKTYEEYGIRISESSAYSADAKKLAAFDEDIKIEKNNGFSYKVSPVKNGIKLASGQTYYYSVYVVEDGIEYKGERGTFTTLTQSQTLPKLTTDTEDITADDVTFVGIHDDEPYINNATEYCGVYIGTSMDNMEKIGGEKSLFDGQGKFSSTTTTVKNYLPGLHHKPEEGIRWGECYFRCTAKNLGLELEPYTEYFWKFYVIWGGEEYTSDVASFTTDIE